MTELKTYFHNLRWFTSEFWIHRLHHFSDDEDNMDEDEEKIAVAATFGISAVFKSPKSPGRDPHNKNTLTHSGPSKGPSGQNVDRERLTVDISALKQQYSKLRQRQKQAQIILSSEYMKFKFAL